MKICIISRDATYGNGAVLSEGLKHFCNVTTIFYYKDPKGMCEQTDCIITHNIPDADHYIVIGAISFGGLPKKVRRNMIAIFTDSTYMNNPERYNKLVNGSTVWAMPDLAGLANTDNIYYQPFKMPVVDTEKTKLICHSPFHELKYGQKGTKHIIEVCKRNNLPLTLITGKTWFETIKIKAQHKICVDQIIRGLGKSGLEGMLLGCSVISGVKPKCDNLPPVTWTNKKNFEVDLLKLIDNYNKPEQIKWAEENLKPEVMAEKIFKSL